MGQSVSELIAQHRVLTQKLRDLISSDNEINEAAVRELDGQESELFFQILNADLSGEVDLRTRIQFLKQHIAHIADGDKSIVRDLDLLCADFEKLLDLKGSQNRLRNCN